LPMRILSLVPKSVRHQGRIRSDASRASHRVGSVRRWRTSSRGSRSPSPVCSRSSRSCKP
jgi:hypothetical protein